MRRLLFLLFLFLVTIVHAQENANAQKTFIGVKAGRSHFDVSGTQVDFIRQINRDDVVPHKDILLGVIVKTDINRLFQVKVEANRIVKGGDYVGNNSYERQDRVVTYLQIPLLLGFKLPTHSAIGVSLEAGAASNFVIKPMPYNTNNYLNASSIKTPTSMFSPVAGVEVSYSSGKFYYFLNYRYDFDSQKYFEREYLTSYYLKHDGGNTLSVGLLYRINKDN